MSIGKFQNYCLDQFFELEIEIRRVLDRITAERGVSDTEGGEGPK